jgi:capsular polysaccharide export protein
MLNREDWTGKSVLLLQGPIGPYFRRLARDLRHAGASRVLKVNFCGGDQLFYPGGIPYTGPQGEVPAFVEDLVRAGSLDAVALFGDCRPVHAGIAAACARAGVRLYVFEEGYFRPSWVTCEEGGVNGHSVIPASADFFRSLSTQPPEVERPPRRLTYYAMAGWAMLYYLASLLLRPRYRRYVHHRDTGVLRESARWVRGMARKYLYVWRERGLQHRLTTQHHKGLFLVPLQVHNDAQILTHSNYAVVPQFIEEVLVSFARHAPAGRILVFKHHPMDRAYRDYGELIASLAAAHGVTDRVHYVHDLHLPTLLDSACGAVVVNSTVGLAAVHQGVPAKVMGRAFYDFEGLTFQGSLEAFWHAHADAAPDPTLYLAFRRWVIAQTQINDNFYAAIPGVGPVVRHVPRHLPRASSTRSSPNPAPDA